MTRAAAFALWILFLSPVSFAQDAAPDSEAADSGGTYSGGTDSGGTDSGGTYSGGTDSGDDGTGAATNASCTPSASAGTVSYGAASMAGETGGCQGCASSGGLSVSMAVFGLLLVGLSRRQAR